MKVPRGKAKRASYWQKGQLFCRCWCTGLIAQVAWPAEQVSWGCPLFDLALGDRHKHESHTHTRWV